MKRTKKLIALLLVCASICTLLPAVPQTANAITLTSTTTGTADPGFVTYYDDFESYTSQEEYNQVWQDIPLKNSDTTSAPTTGSSLVLNADGTKSMKPGSGSADCFTTVNPAYRGSGMLTQFKVVMNYKGSTESADKWYMHYTIVPYKGLKDDNYIVMQTGHHPTDTNASYVSLRFSGSESRVNGIDKRMLNPLSFPVQGSEDAEITLTFDYTYVKNDVPTKCSWVGTYYSWIEVKITAEVSGKDPVSKKLYIVPANEASDTNASHGRLSDKFTAGIYTDNTMPATFKSISYTYAKGPKELADDWKADYAAILAKNVADIKESDRAAVNAAIADYNTLKDKYGEDVERLLTDEYTKLNGFQAKLAGTAAEAYFATYGEIFASGFKADSAAKTVLLRQALKTYNDFESVTKAAVDAKALADYSVGSIPAKIAELTKAYYFYGNTLVYDDFNSYTSQEAYNQVWQDIPLKNSDTTSTLTTPSSLVPNADDTQSMKPGSGSNNCFTTVKPAYRGDGMLTQFKVVMNYDGTSLTGSWYNHKTIVPYKGLGDDNGDNYISLVMGHGVGDNYPHLRFNANQAGTGIKLKAKKDLAFPVKGLEAAVITLTFDYTYVENAEPTVLFGNWGGTYYSWIEVKITAEVSGEAPVSQTMYIVPATEASATDDALGKMPNQKFTAGICANTTLPAAFESISYTYAKSEDEYSAEFEAYQGTYDMSTSVVTKDKLEDINAALAVYDTLNDTQKSAYAREKANLDALKAVAQFHSKVALVTPATNYTALSAEYAALGVTNETVKGAVDAIAEALKNFEPTLHSATIKADADPVAQRLRFNVKFNTLTYEGFTVKEYGVVMLPNQMLGGAELKLDTANAVKSTGISETLPEQFRGYLAGMGHDGGMCATRIAARAYVIYVVDEVEYVYYSTNTTEGYDAGVPTKGTSEGVAVRSVYSIAKAMATNLLANKDNYTLDYSTQSAITAATESIEGIASADILTFVVANAAVVETIG